MEGTKKLAAADAVRARNGMTMTASQEKSKDRIAVDLGLLLPVGNRLYHVMMCCDESGGTGAFFVKDLDKTVTCDFCRCKHRVCSLEDAIEDRVFEHSEGLLTFDAYEMLTFMLRRFKEQAVAR